MPLENIPVADDEEKIHCILSKADLSLEAIVNIKLRSCFTNMEKMESGDVYSMVLEQVERPLIRFVLEKSRGNQVRAADILGINRNTLRKKITELGIEVKKDL